MNAGKAVYGILSANSGVTDIVGTNIFPEIAEQETAVPFIVYQLQSVDPDDTHDGPSKLDEVRFEFLCYADSYNAAADLGVAVRAALDRVSGTYNGVHVESIQFNDVDVNIEYDPRRYSQVLTFTFRIKRDDVTIALGTPVTGAVLGDLSDVDVTGVTNGQLIAYNSTSGNWEAANDAGGAEELDDLSDVKIVGTPSEGDALVYQSGFFQLGQAGATTLGDLSDVNTTGAAAGSLISYNGVDGWEISAGELPSDQVYYHNRYASEAETLLDGATETVELYYTAQADGDGLHEDAQSDTATTGYDIRRKLYYAEKAQADPNTSGDWTQFADIADDTTYASAKATLLAYLKARTGGTVPISLKMTWEEVAEAPAFTGLLNESYGSGAEAAYSTRRLNGNVTECMVIRRASDSTTQTIGFDGSGNIDESAIETFCTGTTCTVVTWKDQSGNGNDATAPSTTEEPTIYTGGALVKENGRVALDFDGSTDFYSATISDISQAFDIYSIYKHDAQVSSGTERLYITTNTVTKGRNGSSNDFIHAGTVLSSSSGALQETIRMQESHVYNGASSIYRRGGTEITSGNAGTSSTGTTIYIGSNSTGQANNCLEGNIQEFILFDNSKTTGDRTSVEENQGDYFTQNTPLLDTYTGAAAAYSLRKLRSAYSGSAIRVRRASDNTEQDIGFNVFGELDTVSLASFCSGTNGFVTKWYDQASTNDATQTTAANQPKIYDSSTGVVTENGKPAVEFDGSDDILINTTVQNSFEGAAQAFTMLHVAQTDNTGNFQYSFSLLDGTNSTLAQNDQIGILAANDNKSGAFIRDYSTGTTSLPKSTATVGTSQHLNTAVNTGSTLSVYANGTAGDSVSVNYPALAFDYASVGGRHGGSTPSSDTRWNGKIQEILAYASDQSSNRTNIEDNINTFYSIY